MRSSDITARIHREIFMGYHRDIMGDLRRISDAISQGETQGDLFRISQDISGYLRRSLLDI
jgi:hypothetical protein